MLIFKYLFTGDNASVLVNPADKNHNTLHVSGLYPLPVCLLLIGKILT